MTKTFTLFRSDCFYGDGITLWINRTEEFFPELAGKDSFKLTLSTTRKKGGFPLTIASVIPESSIPHAFFGNNCVQLLIQNMPTLADIFGFSYQAYAPFAPQTFYARIKS